jgi:hypothetical protein
VTWEPLNLVHLEERPPVEPTLGELGLIYPGRRHVLSGPQESAKTLAAYAIALAEIRAGGLVLLIDLEMGPHDARERLRDLRATDGDLDRLLYVEPETPADAEIIAALVELAPTLVVIDAAAGAYDLQGLDDNKRADVERFAGIFIRAFWLAGIATVLIDHVVKNSEARGKYAIGSERKVGSADVHLGFEVVTPISRGGTGLYKIITHKDRGGWLSRPKAAEFELRSDPQTHAIDWTFCAPREQAGAWQPTALMERVSRYLEAQSEPVSRNAIEKDVKGKRDYKRLAIDCLIEEGFAGESSGTNRARLIASVRPFREDEFAPGSPRLDSEEFAPGSPRQESLNEAVNAGSPQFAPSSPLAPEFEFALDRSRLQGGANRRGEVVTPVIGDEMYPILLAEAGNGGHITEEEFSELYALHKWLERCLTPGGGVMTASQKRSSSVRQLSARAEEKSNETGELCGMSRDFYVGTREKEADC